MVNTERDDASAEGAEPARGKHSRELNKISATTKYSFTGRNLTAYGGLLPVAAMPEKLEFRELVGTSVNLELKRMPRAMPPCDFLLGMILAVYVGFSRLNHLQYLEREPLLLGILRVPRLPVQSTFWRFLSSLHLSVERQLGSLNARLRERVWAAANIRLNHIPYKSSAPALQDVLAGRVPMMMAAVATASPFIKDGRLVPLATGGTERLSFLPELPTLIESGFPGLEVISWIAVLGPKSMPPALAERISRDINRVTQSKAYREALQQRGSDARTSTPQGLAERMRVDYERTQALINTLGIKKN